MPSRRENGFEAMNAFIESTGLRPVIDRVFEFEQAHEAFHYFASGTHFGKVCIHGRTESFS